MKLLVTAFRVNRIMLWTGNQIRERALFELMHLTGFELRENRSRNYRLELVASVHKSQLIIYNCYACIIILVDGV